MEENQKDFDIWGWMGQNQPKSLDEKILRDFHGNAPIIDETYAEDLPQLTKNAQIYISTILEKAEDFFRVAVVGGGCSGFQYTFSLENELNEDGVTIFEKHSSTQFYDYTKSFKRMCNFLGKPFIKGETFPSNYHLTFSRSENNDKKCEMVLSMGGNVAVVFRNQLPETWKGFEVVNGDESDLRFLDKKGVVVGLIEKGLAKKDETGFVVEGINS